MGRIGQSTTIQLQIQAKDSCHPTICFLPPSQPQFRSVADGTYPTANAEDAEGSIAVAVQYHSTVSIVTPLLPIRRTSGGSNSKCLASSFA